MKVLIISGTILPLPSDRLQMSPSGAAYIDMRPRIKSIVDTIKQNSNADIVLGGSGFNYYAKDWLDYLNLDYGIRGEGENSLSVRLERPRKLSLKPLVSLIAIL